MRLKSSLYSPVLTVLFMVFSFSAMAADSIIPNGDFEKGLEGFAFWARDAAAGKVVVDAAEHHGGAQALRVEHAGEKDWSLACNKQLTAKPGEIYELSAWVRLKGAGHARLGVVTRDASGKTISWEHGGRSVYETKDWVKVQARFIIPPGTASIQPRLTGYAASTAWVDDVELAGKGSLDALRNKDLPATASIRNDKLELVFRTADASFEIKDLASNRALTQHADNNPFVVLGAKASGSALDLSLLDAASMRTLTAVIRLEKDMSECVVTLRADGEMDSPLAWPSPFVTAKGDFLILPVNEGISYPADDPSLSSMFYHLYGGHGLCMPWYGVTDGTAGWLAIVETADDAAVRIPRKNGFLVLEPEWQAQKKMFGPERVIRYAMFGQGGYVAMAKRYREYAKKTGLLKTLAEKRAVNPNVDMLIGAVNVWCWENTAPELCREMQSLGIKRILWSNARPPDQLKALNELGVLTSRYDIFQDAMNPAEFPKLKWLHGDWTSDAWKNDDLMIQADGEWVRGWEIESKSGGMIPCGTLCDRQAVPYAEKRIPAELLTHPYRSRFIDTTTASPWRECYHPKHPMTRTESKKYKMDLLRYISEGCGLICGSETGHDAAVPYTHYFEGMLSLGQYRVPDAGRDMQRIWDEVPENVGKFQTGSSYRLPLWELVYHDCLVAQWYWGDYNNKLPKLWDRRDLWNALYGTPPMFMFNKKVWEANKDRFVKSYKVATPVARATGYSEMISHEWLKQDHTVQRTRFANGVMVTVNFGDEAYTLSNGSVLLPLSMVTEGMKGGD